MEITQEIFFSFREKEDVMNILSMSNTRPISSAVKEASIEQLVEVLAEFY